MATTSLSRADRTAMYVTIVFAAVAAAATVFTATTRLAEVIPSRDVPVLVPFADEFADLPIGAGGAPVAVEVREALIVVPEVAGATHFALIAQPVVIGLAILGAITMLALFCFNLARGRAFSRANVRLVFAATGILLAGWVLGGLFTTMSVNGALSAISEYSYDGVLVQTDFGAMFAILALGAVGAAFQIGERLQRDTEGLV